MTIKLIITDIDGCLTSEGSVPFDPDALFRLARLCRDANRAIGSYPPITLCTGRPQPYVEVLMKLFDVRHPAICENGALIYTLPDNRARYGPGVTAEKVRKLHELRDWIETDLLPRHAGAVYQVGKEAQLSVYCERPATLVEMVPAIEAFAAENGGPDLDIKPSHFYLNISLAGVDKGRAVRALLEELGLSRDEVAGIGDTTGDIPLREAVGFFACPANSQEGLKPHADYVAQAAEAEGVMEILERLRSMNHGRN